MIELNCTYEESKKILELGYDFAPVCTRFTLQSCHFYHFIKIRPDFFAPDAYDWANDLLPFNSWESMRKCGIIPIIPKAALEACLPDKQYGNKPLAGNTAICYARTFQKSFAPFHINTLSVWEIGGDVVEDEKGCGLTTYFKSAYEAFIWMHENYPEELKKKFEEVMR